MPILIKRYANRKLYNTATSRYITLRGIAELLENNEELKVVDNETGEDITSVTLSQILVDTGREHRTPPNNLLNELFNRGGELYEALRRVGDDASEGIEEFQRNVRRLVKPSQQSDADRTRNWIVFGPPDFEKMMHQAFERVAEALDLPRRSDIEALNARIDQLSARIDTKLAERGDAPAPRTEPPPDTSEAKAPHTSPPPAASAAAATTHWESEEQRREG